jgi:hypothetical protein
MAERRTETDDKPHASAILSPEDMALCADALMLAADSLKETAALLRMRNAKAIGVADFRAIAARMSALHERITS